MGTQDQRELVTLSPGYGSSNTITTELDTVRVTVNTASLPWAPIPGSSISRIRLPACSRCITVPVTVIVTLPAPPRRHQPHRLRRPQPVAPPPASPPPPPPVAPPASPPAASTSAPAAVFAEFQDYGLSGRALGDRGQGPEHDAYLESAEERDHQHVWEPKTSVNWVTLSA